MNAENIDFAMTLVGNAWPRQNFTGETLALWRRTLRFFDLGVVNDTIDLLVRQGQVWRPSVGEFVDAYRAQRRGVEAQEPPPVPPEHDLPEADRVTRVRALKRVIREQIPYDEALERERADA